jgi:hypothetical protein
LVEETGENHWPVTNMEKADVCPQKNTFTCNYKHESFTLPYFCVSHPDLDIQQVGGFLCVSSTNKTEILLKVALNTIIHCHSNHWTQKCHNIFLWISRSWFETQKYGKVKLSCL